LPASHIVDAQWVARDRNLQRFVTEQPPYSILVRAIEADVLPTCQRHGMGVFFLITGLLVIAFAAYLLVGGFHEFGEAGAGEVFEVAGPIVAVVFAVVCGWLYVRGSRSAPPAAAPAAAATVSAPTVSTQTTRTTTPEAVRPSA
jgi:hypothetical protein